MGYSFFDIWDIKESNKLRQLFVVGSAEALGTAVLLFLGCSSAIPLNDSTSPPIINQAVTFGFTVTIAVMSIGHISGCHINPAVSLAALIFGKLSPVTFLVYFASQLIGALIGMSALMIASSTINDNKWDYCVTQVDPNIGLAKGVFIEFILTGILTLIVCSCWDPRNSDKIDSVPVKFGVSIIALVISGAQFTGCSMNPVRSFAPALLMGNQKDNWVYWVGPLLGAAVASTFYKFVYLKHFYTNVSTEDKENKKIDPLLTTVMSSVGQHINKEKV